MYDIIIIGAGIIGSTLFYELSKQSVQVCIVEKNNQAGLEVTNHNSAIIHNGIDPADGSLKAKYNLLAAPIYAAYCQELETPYKQIGAYVVAKHQDELKHLNELYRIALRRHVPARLLSREEALINEPYLSDNVVGVLDMPTTAIIQPTHLSQQAIHKGIQNGGVAEFNTKVINIIKKNDYFEVYTPNGIFQSKLVVNASGLFASEIEQMVSKPSFTLRYRRGEYLVLSSLASYISSRIFYPVPSPLGKGVLFVPTIEGKFLIGPNAVEVETRSEDVVTEAGIQEVKDKIKYMMKDIPLNYEIERFSGLRPRVDSDDFILSESPYTKHFFNFVGIESPGISSAPAIAQDMVKTVLIPTLRSVEHHD
jgi:glycerol-3-phosphate dehydrogenase